MRQFKKCLLLPIVGVFMGCSNSAHTDSVQALTQWDNVYSECSAQEKSSNFIFPKNDWFDGLSMDEKKRVTIYLHQVKIYECLDNRQEILQQALEQEDNKALLEMFTGLGLFKAPDEALVSELDTDKLTEFKNQILIFNLKTIAEQQGFYQSR